MSNWPYLLGGLLISIGAVAAIGLALLLTHSLGP